MELAVLDVSGLLEGAFEAPGYHWEGDRACLALAIELDAEVYTADSAWRSIDIGLPIHLIR